MFKLRHAMIPACISFGPLLMSRMGGTVTGGLGTGTVWVGVVLLTCGLHLILELVMQQQAFIEECRSKQRDKNDA